MKIVVGKPLRSPKFAARLRDACDEFPSCPPLNKGRLTWLRTELTKRGTVVSVESVRKWLAGEGRPKQDKAESLASILAVNPIWLYMGDGNQHEGSLVTPAPMNSASNPILQVMVRQNLIVSISGLPIDLNEAEAQRIANIVLAHAVSS